MGRAVASTADEARLEAVRAIIARAVLERAEQPGRLGAFTLRRAQRGTVDRIRAALSEFGGALLADAPGTGKTVVALAVASAYPEALVVVPATLRAQWSAAAARAQVALHLVSFEMLSRGDTLIQAPLVIVDEAHHVRTTTTRRYAAVARACVGAHVLLLSATPVVNRRADRDALLTLFLGTRATSLSRGDASRIIVRRTPEAELRPSVVRLAPLIGAADVPGIAEALRALPPAFPAADGTAARALVMISLVFAWCSSLAALEAALRRRSQRGEALRDSLRTGRWPSRAQLGGWVVADDSTQLALAEILVPDRSTDLDISAAIVTVDAHLHAVSALRERVGPLVAADTQARATAIRTLLRERPDERVVLFARHADTVHALHRSLRAEHGVVAITGIRARSAAGQWTRSDVLDALAAPDLTRLSLDPRAIRLLLATDLLAEGVDMPGVRTIVHGDLAWTPARLEQRLGRITRASSASGVVQEAHFALPASAEPLLRLAERLRDKRVARRRALDVSDAQEELSTALMHWDRPMPRRGSTRPTIAAVESDRSGFLAVIRAAPDAVRHSELIGATEESGAWRLTTDPRHLATLARAATGRSIRVPRAAELAVRTAIRAWQMARTSRALAGRSSGRSGARSGASSLATLLVARLGRLIANAPFLERAEIARTDQKLRRALDVGIGAAGERSLRQAIRSGANDRDFLACVREVLGRVRRSTTGESAPEREGREPKPHEDEILTLLLLTLRADLPPATRPSVRPSVSP